MAAGTLLWVAVAGLVAVRAADIGWETKGAYQACLETQAKKWIAAKVELVVNLNPAASKIDDPVVAKWTLQALKACGTQAGRDQASEQLFVKYMARWREHIDAGATEIRRRVRPD